MLSKLFAFSTLAILAVATPTPGESPASCSTGAIQCCDSVEKASDPAAAGILAGLGVVVQDIDALVGLTCSPISVIGVGTGSACSGTTVSCTNGVVVRFHSYPSCKWSY